MGYTSPPASCHANQAENGTASFGLVWPAAVVEQQHQMYAASLLQHRIYKHSDHAVPCKHHPSTTKCTDLGSLLTLTHAPEEIWNV